MARTASAASCAPMTPGRQADSELRHHPGKSVGVWAEKDATGRDMHRNIRREGAARQDRRSHRRSAAACGKIQRSTSLPTASISPSATRLPISTDRCARRQSLHRPRSCRSIDTGKYVCHFQYIAHDVWIGASARRCWSTCGTRAGKRSGVIHAGKTGYAHVHDRKDCS